SKTPPSERANGLRCKPFLALEHPSVCQNADPMNRGPLSGEGHDSSGSPLLCSPLGALDCLIFREERFALQTVPRSSHPALGGLKALEQNGKPAKSSTSPP